MKFDEIKAGQFLSIAKTFSFILEKTNKEIIFIQPNEKYQTLYFYKTKTPKEWNENLSDVTPSVKFDEFSSQKNSCKKFLLIS